MQAYLGAAVTGVGRPVWLCVDLCWRGAADEFLPVGPADPRIENVECIRSFRSAETGDGELVRHRFCFLLKPRKPGIYRIEPMAVECSSRDGKTRTFKTEALELRVERRSWPLWAGIALGVAAVVGVAIILKRRRREVAPPLSPTQQALARIADLKPLVLEGDFDKYLLGLRRIVEDYLREAEGVRGDYPAWWESRCPEWKGRLEELFSVTGEARFAQQKLDRSDADRITDGIVQFIKSREKQDGC